MALGWSLKRFATVTAGNVDEGVAAQITQVATHLTIELRLFQRRPNLVAIDLTCRSAGPAVAHLENMHARGTDDRVGNLANLEACDLRAEIGADRALAHPAEITAVLRTGRSRHLTARAERSAPPRIEWTRPARVLEHARLLGTVVDRQRYLAQQHLGVSGGSDIVLECQVDLFLGDHDAGAQHAAHHLDPCDLGT